MRKSEGNISNKKYQGCKKQKLRNYIIKRGLKKNSK